MAKPPSRSAVLARELLGTIARGELLPGDPIDLHGLGRRHGVSRTVVREALADLGGKGLVVARPKVGTTVAPESQWNMLDPVLVAVAAAESGSGSMMAEAVALRRIVEPALAADAARDASTAQRAAILLALRRLADAIGAADRDALEAGDAALHDAIAAGCGNRLLRSIDRSLAPVRGLQRERLHEAELVHGQPGPGMLRCLALQTGLVLAIARRDPELAATRALELACAVPAGLAPAEDAPAARRSDAYPAAGAATPAEVFAADDAARPADAPRPTTTACLSAVPADPARPQPAAPAAPSAEPAPRDTEDWPATAILVRDPAAPVPIRRGRLDPIEAGDAGPAVPSLVGGASGPAVARAR